MAAEKSVSAIVEKLLAEGLRHSGQNDQERAAECWRQVLALEPGNPVAAEYLGSTDAPWAPTTEDPDRSPITHTRPSDPDGLRARVEALLVDGDYGGACALILTAQRHAQGEAASNFDERYEVGRVIGEGGMGEVWVCADRELSRPVAIKFMRAGVHLDPVLRARFDRETRIQAHLQHPGVVPVHERGLLPSGVPYFAMQQVRGLTLADVLDGVRRNDAAVISEFPVERLLADFVRVCLTAAFAHSQHVIHRDLKPENIMMGEFGEVYVLDWGVARLGGPRDSVAHLAGQDSEPPRLSEPQPLVGAGSRDPLQLPPSTGLDSPGPGARVGTPSYMAPEQAQDDGAPIDERADVHALGAILFEILTGERLNAGLDAAQALRTAATDLHPRIKQAIQQGQLPVDLGSLVLQATEHDLDRRLASARELGTRVQKLLRGNISLGDRREQARIHRLAAQVALAHSGTELGLSASARAGALRSLHLAVALDPEDGASQATLARLLAETEAELPPAAEDELLAKQAVQRAAASRVSSRLLLGAMILLVSVLLAGVKTWTALVPCLVLGVVTPVWIALMGHRGWVRPAHYLVSGTLGALLATSFGAIFGPLFLAPVLGMGYLFVVVVQSRAEPRLRHALTLIGLLAILLPILLTALEVLPSPYRFVEGRLVIESTVVSLSGVWAYAFMALATSLFLALPIFLAGRVIDQLRSAERRLFAHAWTLRELLQAPEASSGGLGARHLRGNPALARHVARPPTPPRPSAPNLEW